MARRTHDYRLKRDISIRLQLIIEERFGTLYGFLQAMETQGKSALASTVRGWLPPQKLWKLKPNGRAVRRVDWEAVKAPDGSTLIEFCDVLSIRTDYVLLGEGTASRTQSREQRQLAEDVAAHISEALKADGYPHWSASDVDGARALADVVEAAKQEAAFYERLIESAPARIVARNGLLLDLIGQIAKYLPENPEAFAQFLMLTNTGALLEASYSSEEAFAEQPKTRYLSFPDVAPDQLPVSAMNARISAALDRTESDSQQRFELSKDDEVRVRKMLANLRSLQRKPT